MTYEVAKYILHPDTTAAALEEIAYYAGFRGEEAKIEAVDKACLVACDALDMAIAAQAKMEKLNKMKDF